MAVGSVSAANSTLLAITVTSTRDGQYPLKAARERIEKALLAGYEKMQAPPGLVAAVLGPVVGRCP